MKHKYEIDRRYPFEATEDSVCPVPGDAKVFVWMSTGTCNIYSVGAFHIRWVTNGKNTITHFMVVEYPPEKRTGWLNIYDGCPTRFYETRKEADEATRYASGRIACIEVSWFEGQGL